MNAETEAAAPVPRVEDRAARRPPTEQQRALADMLERQGDGFVSMDPDDAIEIILARRPDNGGLATGFVFQPLLHQFPGLLAYGFGRLGLDALILVVPDAASLERLAPLLRDQTPVEHRGKLGVVTGSALDFLFSLYPQTRHSPARDTNKRR